LLDILGARIWIAAHSENWRQRAAAVQAVLSFSQDKLPERYNDGKTKHLFMALMEFARITAEDKVLQIYYLSLKIMTVALAPPICGDDVPPALINKSIQKFMNILI
jgi:centrosomal protein CEP104